MLSKKQILTLGAMLLILALVTGCGGGMGVDINKGKIVGRVTDTSNQPLENVRVSVGTEAGLVAYTNANGEYELVDVIEGSRVLTFSKVGYAYSAAFDTDAERTVTVVKEADARLDVQLLPNSQGVARVSVVDGKGVNLMGVVVSAFAADGTFVNSGVTDLAGKAQIGIPEGQDYTLKFTKIGFGRVEKTVDVEKEKAVDVDTVTLPAATTTGTLYIVANSVTNTTPAVENGRVSGMAVLIRELNQTLTTDADGAVELANVPAGTYTFEVTAAPAYNAIIGSLTIPLGGTGTVNATLSGNYTLTASCVLQLYGGTLPAGRGLFISREALLACGMNANNLVLDGTHTFAIRGAYNGWNFGGDWNTYSPTADVKCYETKDHKGIVVNFDDMLAKAATAAWGDEFQIVEFNASGAIVQQFDGNRRMNILVGPTAGTLNRNYGIAFTQSHLADPLGLNAALADTTKKFVVRGGYNGWSYGGTWGTYSAADDLLCSTTTDDRMLVMNFGDMVTKGGESLAVWTAEVKLLQFSEAGAYEDDFTNNAVISNLFR